jgi:hypothetical protein
MNRFGLFAVFALLVPAPLCAQEDLKGELAGGYSFAQALGGGVNGWSASFAGNPSRYFGIVGDFAGYYKHGGALHSFMFGPRFNYRKHKAVTPFAQVLVGAARATNGGSDSIFTTAIGGGLDFKVAPNLAVRLPQVQYVLARDDGINTGVFRLDLGVVFRF